MYDVQTIREQNLRETINVLTPAQARSALNKIVGGTEVAQAVEEAQRLSK